MTVSSLYVAICPLDGAWRSEPLATMSQVTEALRAHVSSHAQGELVDHVVTREMQTERYDRTTS